MHITLRSNQEMAEADAAIRIHWPLYSILPLAFLGFSAAYFVIFPHLSRRCLGSRYGKLSALNRRCFLQNLTALLHTLLVVAGLLTALNAGFSSEGLLPYYSTAMYIDLCISLGYFLFVLPWSMHMYFILGARAPYTGLDMILHHATVTMGECVYLLTQVAPWYGATALALFEITNWPFIPFTLLTQLNMKGSMVHSCFGFLFVFAFIVCRLFGCTWVAILFVSQVSDLLSRPAHGTDAIKASVVVALVGFMIILALSYYWFVVKVVPNVHAALQELLGDTYHHRFTPRKLRELATAIEGRKARREATQERAKRMRALEEIRAQVQVEAATTDGTHDVLREQGADGDAASSAL